MSNITENQIKCIRDDIIFAPDAKRDYKHMLVENVKNTFRPASDILSRFNISSETMNILSDENAPKACDFYIEVPEHQRFYVWNKRQQIQFINSILNNFPVPDVIVTKGKSRGEYQIEDGQQRLTTLFLFNLNYFHLEHCGHKVFYDCIPENENQNCVTLDDLGIKTKFDEYKINIQLISEFPPETQCDMFERLNSGKQLNDGDKLWNKRETKLVKIAEKIANSDLKNELEKHFGINWALIKDKKRNDLRDLIGLIGGLSVKYDRNDPTSFNVLSRSYSQVFPYLNADDLSTEEQVYQRMNILLDVFYRAYDETHITKNTTLNNRAFGRWLGPMILNMREKENKEGKMYLNVKENYINRWTYILRDFSTDTVNINHPEHPHQIMYKKDDNGQELDNPRKNSSGKLIKQRLVLIKQHYNML